MRGLAVVIVVALTAPAVAAGHKILVLPVDGALDAATRTRLTAEVARLARTLDGQVSVGSATFSDTALAVGCDPRAPSCADEVMATLGVDELVWSTATREGSQTRLTVRRAARGGQPRELSTAFPPGDASERIAAGIAPLFAPAAAAPEPAPRQPHAPEPAPHAPAPPPAVAAAPGEAPTVPTGEPVSPAPVAAPPGAGETRRDLVVGIVLVAHGGAGIVLGLAFWASYASLQDSIDQHPTRTLADFQDLKSLEDRASTRAIAGDAFMLAGLVAGGLGAYYLYRDHSRHAIMIAPAAMPRGGGVTITLIGGP